MREDTQINSFKSVSPAIKALWYCERHVLPMIHLQQQIQAQQTEAVIRQAEFYRRFQPELKAS